MRTRIALVAAILVAFMIISIPAQTANLQSARAATPPTTQTGTVHGFFVPASVLEAYGAKPAATAALVSPPAPGRSGNLLPNINAGLPTVALINLTPTPPPPTPTPAPTPVPAPTPPAPTPVGPVDTVTATQRAEWERVAMCEEGGDWSSDGGRFSGGLGITRSNWRAYGGDEYAPEGAMATEDEQIMVAERIQSSPPDQYGCRGW
jgi:Transglycosylase-like domain